MLFLPVPGHSQGSMGSSAALMHLQEGSAGDLGAWMGFQVLEARFPFPHTLARVVVLQGVCGMPSWAGSGISLL